MGFRRGAYARLWKYDDGKGNYLTAQLSVSRKNQEGKYETAWQDSYVRLIGKAERDIRGLTIPEKGIAVKIGDCDVTNKYDKEKKTTYTNYMIFSFDDIEVDGNASPKKASAPNTVADEGGYANIPDGVDDELPFR